MTVNFNGKNNFFVLPVVVAKAFSSLDAQRKRRLGEGWWLWGAGGTDGRKGEGRRSIPHPSMRHAVSLLFCFDKTKTTPREKTLDKTLK